MAFDRRQFLTGAGILGLDALLSRQISADLTKSPLVIINPGHNHGSQKYSLGCSAPKIGEEYKIVTQIADNLSERLRSRGVQTLVTRDEKEYASGIRAYIDAHKNSLDKEFKDSLQRGYHHDLNMIEGRIQLGIMRYAEERKADAVVSVHIDDVKNEKKNGKEEPGPYVEGFTVYIGNHHAEDLQPKKHKIHIEYDEKSLLLARSVRDALAAEIIGNTTLPASNISLNDNKKNSCGLAAKHLFILGNGHISMKVPSVLVECGFIRQNYVINGITHHINSNPVQQAYADAIAKGIMLNF